MTFVRIAGYWLLLLAAVLWAHPAGSQVEPASSLIVDPPDGIRASGPPGGPFNPPSFQYRLRSSGGPIKYSISTPSWLAANPATGTSDVTGVTITLTINPTANQLAPGSYGPAVAFKNVTSGRGTTVRTSVLVVGGAGAPHDQIKSSAAAPPAPRLPSSSHRPTPPAPRLHPSTSQSPTPGSYLLDEQGGYLLDKGGQRMLAR